MIQHIGKIEHIDIYWDPEKERDEILLGRKGNPIADQGYIYIEDFDEKMKNVKGSSFDKAEVDKILLKQKKAGFKDYNFAVGPFSSLGPYEKLLKEIKNGRN